MRKPTATNGLNTPRNTAFRAAMLADWVYHFPIVTDNAIRGAASMPHRLVAGVVLALFSQFAFAQLTPRAGGGSFRSTGNVVALPADYDEKDGKMMQIIQCEKSILKAIEIYNRY